MTRAPRDSRPSAFWPSLWLAVVLFGAKGAHWGLPNPPDYPVTHWLRDWLVSAHQDVLFAVVFGVLGQAVLWALSRWTSARKWAFRGIVAAGTACAFYAVVAAGVFESLRSPLTYPLLYLAGGVRDMRSSVQGEANLASSAALILVAPAYLLLVRWTTRRWAMSSRVAHIVVATTLVGALAYGALAQRVSEGRWSDRADLLIARSPHWAMISSLVDVAIGAGAPSIATDFPSADLGDFAPMANGSRLPLAVVGVAPPRNVLLVILESSAARYMSLYGGRYRTTPMLEREAAHAVVFDAHYTPVGMTANVMVVLHLSIAPLATWREYTLEQPRIPGVTLATLLRDRGRRTLFVHSGHLDYTNQNGFLADRGYDQVLDWSSLAAGPEVSSWGGDDRLLVDKLLQWIDADRQRPFFACAWTINSHHPYEPVPGQEIVDFFKGDLPPDDYDLGRYLNTVHETDLQLGRLFDGLRERGLADDTLVIVTGDHGQAFGWPHPTWGHGFRLYDENVRVPLMVWNPRLFPSGRRSAAVTSHLDLNPTVAQILGFPPDPSWEGWSVFAERRPPRAYFYAANDAYLLGVREDRWKYILNATRGSEQLFDLASDPDEQTNLAAAQPERCRRLRQRVGAWQAHARGRFERLYGRAD